MADPKKIPERLYKYRAFDLRTVNQLCADEVYFADPNTFNDPLDSKPCIEADLGVDDLELTLTELIRARVSAEMTTAARAISYQGPKTIEHIRSRSEAAAKRAIEELAYSATNPAYVESAPTPHMQLLCNSIERELLRQYDRGVLSLATRYNCPLMWSHYGDQHRGLCLGYSVPEKATARPLPVAYGGVRFVPASKIAEMVDGNAQAREFVDSAILLRKAWDWRYEKEWRLLGPRGVSDSPLELEEVVFGMRCTDPIKYIIAKALAERQRPVKLLEMREVHGTFTLKRFIPDVDGLYQGYPRRANMQDDFAEVFPPIWIARQSQRGI